MSKKQKLENEYAEKIQQMEEEREVLENQLKRALADYQNLEKATFKRMEIMDLQSRKALSEKFLPVLDAIYSGLEAKQDLKNLAQDEKAWADGIEATLQSLEKSFDEIGLKKYVPQKGDIFDPSLHEAVTAVEDGEKGRIYDLIQPGYMLDEVCIRPARVVVSK